MPELVLKLGENTLQNYVFDKDVMSIGRSRDNDIVIENLSVSRNHARIRRQNGKYVLTDLNSANGTYVNGVRVSKTEIVNADVIAIGKHKLHFADEVVAEEQIIADAFGQDRTVIVDRSPAPVICISDGKLKGQEFQLSKFETSIGKAPSNDIVISDDWFLAKKQAVIIRRGNAEYEIHDMGGFRRSKVNGAQVNEPRVLKSGDVLEFGNTRCVFQFTGEEPVPSGRVPQEMALDDSIFSTGVSYNPESEPAEQHEDQEVQTPFIAEMDKEELAAAFDPNAMARAAIEADEVARAEARQHAQAAHADGNGNQQQAQGGYRDPESLDGIEPGWQLEPESARPEEYQPQQAAAAEAAEPEAAEQQEPEPVYAGAEQQSAEQSSEAAASAASVYADLPHNVPLTPAASASSPAPIVSATGGRSNRKKRRERERGAKNGGGETFEPQDSPASEPAESAEAAPSFDERASEEQLATGSPAPVHADASPVAHGAPLATEEEIKLWETALENRSPVIRKQAARMLKKLTGKDYEV